MKKLLMVIVLAAGGWVGYQYSQTGSLPFGSQAPASAEEEQLADLFDQFESARAEFKNALKSAGLTGMDTTSDVDAAVSQVKAIDRSLGKLKPRLKTPEARHKAGELEKAIKDFQARLR
jgi:hypothetical protein